MYRRGRSRNRIVESKVDGTQLVPVADLHLLPLTMSAPAPVSFTVRRPSPISRGPSSGPDSDGPSFKVPALPRHLTNEGSKPGSPLGRASPTGKKAQSRTFEERDSSDEESDGGTDELVTGFDQFGVQRCVPHLAYSSRVGLNSRQLGRPSYHHIERSSVRSQKARSSSHRCRTATGARLRASGVHPSASYPLGERPPRVQTGVLAAWARAVASTLVHS